MRNLFTSLFLLFVTTSWAADYDLNVTSFRLDGSEFSLEDSISCRVIFKNSGMGTDPITSVCIKIDVNGEVIHCDTLTDIAVGSKNFIYNKHVHHGLRWPVKNAVIKGEVYILDADKEDADLTNNFKTKTFNVIGKLVERKVVIEEATALWCGYCPRAIVGMDYVSETYPDDFIGIAVHQGDALNNGAYYGGMFDAYGQFNLPSAWVNRTVGCGSSKTSFEGSYKEQKAILTDVATDITATYEEESNKVTAKMETRFYVHDEAADYRGVFVVLENGVEGYAQTNYLSDEPDLGPFSGGGSYVMVPLNHIARYIYPSYSDRKGSNPAVLDYDVPYTYSETFTISNIQDLNNVEVVGMVLDKDGKIVNADKVKLDLTPTGIEDVTLESTGTPRFFDLSGREIQAPAKGSIYVEQYTDGKSVKRMAR